MSAFDESLNSKLAGKEEILVNTFVTLRTERVIEGAGALAEIEVELERRGLQRIMVISSRSVSQSSEFQAMIQSLGDRIAVVDSTIRAHNPLSGVLQLASTARAHAIDGLLSIGGGSPVDAAKLISLCLSANIESRDELLPFTVSRGLAPFDARDLLPVLAVPTTLSAAEWNGVAAFVDEEVQTKELVRYVELTPKSIFLDPALCRHTPRELWMQTGVRAIDHAIETILAPQSHPTTSALASEALAMLARDLKVSSADAANLDAALHCQQAAWMSLQGVHNVPMGLSHSIGHQLGAAGIPHGATSSIVLPHVLRFLEEATPQKQKHVASILAGARGAETPESAADELELLFDSLQAPRSIREFGVAREDLPGIAEICMKEAAAVLAAAPREVTYASILAILEAAY